MTWSWTGDATNVEINGTPVASSGTSYSKTDAVISDTYTIFVDDTISPLSIISSVIDLAGFSLKTTSASTDTTFTFDLTGAPAGSTLQIRNDVDVTWVNSGGTFVGYSSGMNIIYRFKDAGGNLSVTETLTFQSITLNEVNGTNFVNWTVSGISMADIEFYINDGTVNITSPTPVANTINATGLTAGTTYTLYVREKNSSTVGYGLYFPKEVTIAVPPLIDVGNTSEVYANKTGKNLSFEVGQELNLTAKTLEKCDFEWTLNVVPPATKTNVTNDTSDTFNHTFTTIGNFTLTLNVTENATAPSNKETVTWNITVSEKSTGKRIWSHGMPITYKWDGRSFSGFYYNLDNGEGNETMEIKNITGRTIASGNLVYVTTSSLTKYEYSPWGTYSIVGFMGDKYYAGKLMSGGNLSKVLMDESNRKQLRVGQYYALEEGYSLKADQINVQGSSVYFVLEKDGRVVDSGIASPTSPFIYEKKIGNDNIEFVKVHVRQVFQGTESSIVEIDGIFQISDKLTKLETGTKIDKMKIDSVTGTQITLVNDDSINLSQNSTIALMGKMKIVVADSATLKFAPTIEYIDPGKYEIRGTVSDFGIINFDVKKWTPDNFEGFYFDINSATSMENIQITPALALSNTSRTIPKNNLTYSSNVSNTAYNYSAWGNYQVIGFMGEKYYAGATGASLLSNGNLSKVLIDSNDRRTMYVGQSLILEDGYSLKVDQINVQGSSVYFALEKNGRVVDSGIASPTSPFVYEKSVGTVKNVEFVKIHVREVFQGTESSIVLIDGVFQISDSLTKVENGAKYGKMRVDSVTSSGITMLNDDSISLSSGNVVDFMTVGNSSMSFKVGNNSSVLRFAPIVAYEIAANTTLEVEVSPSTVTIGDSVFITVKDRGVAIEGASVLANGTSIGTTNSSGMVSYTPGSIGAIRITGEKTGYINGNATLTVNERLRNMNVSVSPNPLYLGTEGTIRVTEALDPSMAVSGVSVTFSGTPIGQTDFRGELKYNFTQAGTIQASKTGYINGTQSVNVIQNFTYSNFNFNKDSLKAKSTIKLSFDVKNNGPAADSHKVTLIVKNDKGETVSEETQTVSVDGGKSKSVSFSFKVPAEGSYSIALEEDGVRQPLPSNIETISAGPSGSFGFITNIFSGVKNILYIVLGFVGVVVLAVIGLVAYLFGTHGANTSNVTEVGGEVLDDIKSKFKK
jgi:S-layer protein (TIGR01567 family)